MYQGLANGPDLQRSKKQGEELGIQAWVRKAFRDVLRRAKHRGLVSRADRMELR